MHVEHHGDPKHVLLWREAPGKARDAWTRKQAMAMLEQGQAEAPFKACDLLVERPRGTLSTGFSRIPFKVALLKQVGKSDHHGTREVNPKGFALGRLEGVTKGAQTVPQILALDQIKLRSSCKFFLWVVPSCTVIVGKVAGTPFWGQFLGNRVPLNWGGLPNSKVS